jgi:hypothetical protein
MRTTGVILGAKRKSNELNAFERVGWVGLGALGCYTEIAFESLAPVSDRLP